MGRICGEINCSTKHYGKDLCKRCYKRKIENPKRSRKRQGWTLEQREAARIRMTVRMKVYWDKRGRKVPPTEEEKQKLKAARKQAVEERRKEHKRARENRLHGMRKITSKGYILLFLRGRGWLRENRYLMEQHIGRPLTRQEIAHHINEVKTDNTGCPDEHVEGLICGNLQLVTFWEHNQIHDIQYKGAKAGAKKTRGKTYEEIHGEEKGRELREQRMKRE